MAQDLLHPIPNPPGRPVVGNMLTVDSDTPLQSLMQLTREHGPIFKLNMMGTPLVVVSGASLVEEICDEKRFDKAVRGSLRRIRAAAGDGLFTSDTAEPNWSKAHNILLPTFAQRAMAGYLPLMQDIAGQLCLKWERLNADDEIDVVHDMTALALDTIGVCGFDYRFNSFYRRDYHPFIDALTRTLETCMVQRGLPFEKVVLKRRLRQLREDVSFMSKLVDDIIRERRRGGGDQAQKDLLNFMLAGVDKQTGESLSDENIRYQIITFLIAGHETTSGLLSFTLYFLVNNPDVLARAYEEVDRVFGSDLAAMPTFHQVNQLTYVQQILNEALRLWPTAPAIGLYPYKNEVIGDRYSLKKGTFVTLLTLMLHRDPSVWGPEPEKFNPDNFSREAEAARPAHAFKPWGNGQRACIGRQFAMQEATLVLGMILQRFQLFDHLKYQLKIKESLSIKPDGFRIKVKPRPGRTRSAFVPGAVLADQGDKQAQVVSAKRPSHGTRATILFGSNLGTTEELARTVAQSAELNGFETTFADLDSHVGALPKEGAVIIASASYNGAPPDNATRFVKWLDEAGPGAVAGVNYLVFGCGNRDWASTFQATPRFIDERLEALGGRRVIPRGEADAREDLDGHFQSWFKDLWPRLGKALELDVDFSEQTKAEPLYQVEIVQGAPVNPAVGQAGAREMTVLANRELQDSAASGRSTRHIEVALPEGMIYRPGDHLCVVPVNARELVERVERRFGFGPDTQIRLATTGGRHAPFPADGPVPLRRILSDYVELQHVATRKQVETMAEHTRCPVTRPKLQALAAEGAEAYRSEVFVKRKSVLDLLEEFPACELPFGLYLEMLPLMAPRYYSISSSPSAAQGRCAITVGVVEGPARSGSGIYKGVCSNHLVDKGEGAVIHATVKETKAGFRLPDDPARPVIMIGPGTGLAPFRAFLQERAALKAAGTTLGPAMLFFGCRHPDQDFLYRGELEAMAAQGLADLHVAFSRLAGEKTYVQDLLWKERTTVWRLIEAGAHIYVCGDGSRMEPDVKRALARIYAEEKDVDVEAADAWTDEMSRTSRYVLDVWAGN
ncbi:bifunctional cytochrome P450/NADPH--P450 reductase [Mesorhizobium sp. L-8-3]|uniref:bifunctional cytochrome P450/NADPH--P450 reductase n=1 Tax=Mesorhizobium sp. L-8-3 TaxID=2744522 RepID=UPI00193601F7|nr:cytochrome P450 [Mesorhizobium sp. L-8-3]BCH24465.1 NADPH--cytochrome P450 reductase [Mesorhizobium sp. L-8-3]